MSGKCCVCQRPCDETTSPILYMSGAGIPRCLCDDCDKNIENATHSKEPDSIKSAIASLGRALEDGETGDMTVIAKINEIIAVADERREKIEAGEYDFALDEEDEGEDFVLTEDMLETEEDKQLTEEENRRAKIIDTVTTWIMGILIVAAVAFFVIKFVL